MASLMRDHSPGLRPRTGYAYLTVISTHNCQSQTPFGRLYHNQSNMNKKYIALVLFSFFVCVGFISCKPSMSIKTTAAWVNREKLPPEPIKSVFIIAFTDNPEVRVQLEDDVAAAAAKKGIKAYKSLDIIGPVELNQVAPVRDVFLKKLKDLNCEAVYTIALVDSKSETHYTPPTDAPGVYTPYSYAPYMQYSGYNAARSGYGPYGGFGGYYGFAIGNLSTPGYYTTNSKYFIETKLFDLNTDETLLSMQSKVANPDDIKKASQKYVESVVKTIKDLKVRKS